MADDRERAVVFGSLAVLCAALCWLGVPPIKAGLLTILALLVVLFTNPYQRWRYRHIPGPPYHFLVGNLPDFMSCGSHAFLDECKKVYGPVFKVWFGARPWVVVADADLGRRVNYRLINRPSGFTNPLASGDVLRASLEGLFLSRDGMWSMLRKVWQPTFHSESLHGYAPVMAKETRRLVRELSTVAASAPGGGETDIWRDVGRMTMSVVGSAAYGVDFHLLDGGKAPPSAAAPPAVGSPVPAAGAAGGEGGKEWLKLVQAAQDMFSSAEIGSATRYLVAAHLMPVMVPFIKVMAALLPDERYRRLIRARTTLRNCSQSLIDATRGIQSRGGGAQQPSPPPSPGSSSGPHGGRPVGVAPGSFLGLLLAARDQQGHALSDRQMAAQANVFTLAGYETTANTLSYAIYCLAAHPEAQQRLLAELDALEGPRDREITVDDLPNLPYTAAVVDEALRLYPPGANTMRQAKGGMELGGYAVPDGSTVLVAIYSIQRDPGYWPKAEKFLPERWLEGNEDLKASNPNAYLPFGSGARMCIGYRFALQEARLTLAQLYRNFTFQLSPGQVPLRVRTGITMSPADGVRVRVAQRE